MYRLSLACVAIGLVAALSLVLPPGGAEAQSAGKNLLINPGFEDALGGHPWMPAGWDTSRAGLQTVFFGRDSFVAHSGTFAVSVANVSSVWPLAHNWSQTMPIPHAWWGKDIVFSVWSRSVGVNGRGYALVQAFRDTLTKVALQHRVSRDSAERILNIKKADDPLLELGWQRVFFSDAETEWVRREVRIYIAPSTNVLFVRCGLLGTGQVIFDDASLTLQPAAPPAPLPLRTNLLKEPGFEQNGDGWEYSLPPYQGLRAVIDSAVVHSGRAAVMITGGENGWIQARAGVCQVLGNRNLSGKRVRLSGYVKTDSLMGHAYLKLYAHTLRGVVQAEPSGAYSMNTDWTLASAEMDVPEDTFELWGWFTYNAPVEGIVYFDDASLEVLGNATTAGRGRPRP